MKKSFLLLFIIVVLFFYGCGDSDDPADYSGEYNGSMLYDGEFCGVWYAVVGTDQSVDLEAEDGILRTFKGSVFSSGRVSVTGCDETATTGSGNCTIENNYVSGSLDTDGFDIDLEGKFLDTDADYSGTRYEETEEGYYYKYVIGSDNSYAVYDYLEAEEVYNTTPIDEGDFTISGCRINLMPDNGVTESGLVYLTDDDIFLIALEGLSPVMSLCRTDPAAGN